MALLLTFRDESLIGVEGAGEDARRRLQQVASPGVAGARVRREPHPRQVHPEPDGG